MTALLDRLADWWLERRSDQELGRIALARSRAIERGEMKVISFEEMCRRLDIQSPAEATEPEPERVQG